MKARSQVAALISADSSDIYFTAGGTESDNWAIKGVAEAAGSGHIIKARWSTMRCWTPANIFKAAAST